MNCETLLGCLSKYGFICAPNYLHIMKNLLLLSFLLTGLCFAEATLAAPTATTTSQKASPDRHRRHMQRLHRQSQMRVRQSKRAR